MHYLYHRVPENLQGDHIVPLNRLKELNIELYEKQQKKYIGREAIMLDAIPPLECLWNDVVFLSPVHPKDILEALTAVGVPMLRREFFKIEASTLDSSLTTIWLHHSDRKTPETFVPFRPEELEQYTRIPPRTHCYYRSQKAAGRQVLLFAHIPHVLFKGSIDIRGLERISV